MTDIEKTVKAHQYLYYIECRPIWSDYDYDKYCQQNNIISIGGSDRKTDYTPEVALLAQQMLSSPHLFKPIPRDQ